MRNFDILEKGLGIDSPPLFVDDFSRKMLSMFSIIDQISLSDCLYFLSTGQYVYCNCLCPKL